MFSSFSNDLATKLYFLFFFLSAPGSQKHLRIITIFVQLMFPLARFHPKMSVVHAEMLWRAGPGRVPVVHFRWSMWLHSDPVRRLPQRASTSGARSLWFHARCTLRIGKYTSERGGSAKDARRPETFKRDGDENEEKWPSAAECKIERVLTIVEEEYYEGSLPCFPGRISWSAFSLW